LVVAAANYLPHLGDQIAAATGLGHTFVGSILIALTTSLSIASKTAPFHSGMSIAPLKA
jgi:hypothetical protein